MEEKNDLINIDQMMDTVFERAMKNSKMANLFFNYLEKNLPEILATSSIPPWRLGVFYRSMRNEARDKTLDKRIEQLVKQSGSSKKNLEDVEDIHNMKNISVTVVEE